MSNQPENTNQQPETVTPEEVRQSLLAELQASKQVIAELSDEQLETIAGAGSRWDGVKALYQISRKGGDSPLSSAITAVSKGPKFGMGRAEKGDHGSQDMYKKSADHLWMREGQILPPPKL